MASPSPLILSGDIGGTKANLALYRRQDASLTEVRSARVETERHKSFEDLLESFLADTTAPREPIVSAAFGIAGPVLHNRVVGTNIPWTVDARDVARSLGVPRVELVNDLEATAFGLEALGARDVLTLQAGHPDAEGTIAVIAAGTGLGEAYAAREHDRLLPRASEGGHSDFAPNNDEQDALLHYLRARFGGHVSYERVVSGQGLGNVYEFLRDTGREEEPAWLAQARAAGDPHAAVADADGKAPIATHALDIFIDAFGAEAGNIALKFMATGGVYVAGGIAPKLKGRMTDGRFLRAFHDKGRLSPVLDQVPIQLVLNDRTALLGAALLASRIAAPLS